MFPPLEDLSKCRILISNDDGIGAPGLAVLERIANQLSDDVWVVAPHAEQSGAGHSLTLHHPLRPTKLGEKRYTIDGTPTDCVLVAVNHVMKDNPPDLVLSGVNMGANLGEDVHYSGTVAAALEGTLLGIPAIAMSQVFSDVENIPWETAEHFAPNLIRTACKASWGRNVLINVNFPDCAPDDVVRTRVVRQGKHKIGDDLVSRYDPRGRPYLWIGSRRLSDGNADDTDMASIAANQIAITPLCVDLTDQGTLSALGSVLE